jgi:hypothetical protein
VPCSWEALGVLLGVLNGEGELALMVGKTTMITGMYDG